MRTIIVWYRNDLRVHDHPALHAAATDADCVIPVFVLDRALLTGDRQSSNRNRFLLQSLHDLKRSLKELGADLIVREGDAATELATLAREHQADAVYYSTDYTGYAIKRDKHVIEHLRAAAIDFRGFGGRLLVDASPKLRTKSDSVFKVFTPFWKAWAQAPTRTVSPVPVSLRLPAHIALGSLPALKDITVADMMSPDARKGGEVAARVRLAEFLDSDVRDYHQTNNDLGRDGTSRLSSYLHFGCISALDIASQLGDGQGERAFHRQLAWRDFYNYVLLHYPKNATQEFQERYRSYRWDDNPDLFKAWQDGRTGYPVVDAAMRQLRQEGWMHNRARLIVGSFLTKDLGLDWRLGERYFMQWLIDGDQANNNGNWQWIASVGVDPAPVFRRLYNPSSQATNYDPQGIYIRRYVPELAHVTDAHLAEPWKMSDADQEAAQCQIGRDYPAPIVDHAEARRAALERYRSYAA